MALRENSCAEGGSVYFNFRLKERKKCMIMDLNHSQEIDVCTCVPSLLFGGPVQRVLTFCRNKIICLDMSVAPNKAPEIKVRLFHLNNKLLTHSAVVTK
jgi:hypothetical protein